MLAAVAPALPVAGPYDRAAARREVDDLLLRVGLDPEPCLVRARALLAVAQEADDDDVVVHALVLEADALHRLGGVADAARIVTAVRETRPDLSAEHRVRTGWVLMRVCSNIGDSATALEHAVETARWLGDDIPPRLRIQFTIKYGDVLDAVGDVEGARERYEQAEQLAVGDPELHLRAVNNRAYTELSLGDTERAVAGAEHLVELAERYGHPLNSDELDTLAHIHLMQHRPELAVAAAQEALGLLTVKGNKGRDDLPEILLTLGIAHRHLGDLDTAAGHLGRAREIVASHGFSELTARVFEEEAELLAARGDFRGALEAHKAFHLADKELVSLQREAQSRARQAMYESTQARADAARFREEARRDPLTGLHNRLAVGERLPALLDARTRGGMLVVAALFDLDHFKAVNDVYSHEAGDHVLVTFAELLAASVADLPEGSGLAARLGGEEFLLVLAATTAAEAMQRIGAVRRAVEEHDWSSTTPGRSVTVSAGVAVADDDSTHFSLLRRADVELYAAKAAGRNRVCGGV
ncbi:diguanylate cyclase [Kineococcus rubinsiae]|uniref:diguanylate cyclase n=1 Tax=Kineococcus rubinsiae TaxID=2609562 RepID=UPI001431DE00|nr:diguanylate cyclase [Kineococcus rubinsiae]